MQRRAETALGSRGRADLPPQRTLTRHRPRVSARRHRASDLAADSPRTNRFPAAARPMSRTYRPRTPQAMYRQRQSSRRAQAPSGYCTDLRCFSPRDKWVRGLGERGGNDRLANRSIRVLHASSHAKFRGQILARTQRTSFALGPRPATDDRSAPNLGCLRVRKTRRRKTSKPAQGAGLLQCTGVTLSACRVWPTRLNGC